MTAAGEPIVRSRSPAPPAPTFPSGPDGWAAPDTRPDKISDGTFSQVRGLHGNGLRSRCCCCVPALKCLYLVTRSLDPTGTGRTRWATRWKPALNAFAITFGDRFPAAETY